MPDVVRFAKFWAVLRMTVRTVAVCAFDAGSGSRSRRFRPPTVLPDDVGAGQIMPSESR